MKLVTNPQGLEFAREARRQGVSRHLYEERKRSGEISRYLSSIATGEPFSSPGSATRFIESTHLVTVDYRLTLEQMVTVGRYDWTNNDITAKNFPISGEGTVDREIAFFHFDREMSSDEVIAEMKQGGYRPAMIEGHLALGAQHFELQRNFPIVSLGSRWRARDGGVRVPYLDMWHVGRGLDLYRFDVRWDAIWRFAAVRA